MLSNGKALGEDMITAELLKANTDFTTTKEKELLDRVWRHEKSQLNGKGGSL